MVWQKGESGNPDGRPRGARDTLTEEMYQQACTHWRAHGAAVLDEVRQKSPERYLTFMARILPKSHQVEVDNSWEDKPLVEMTNLEILQVIYSERDIPESVRNSIEELLLEDIRLAASERASLPYPKGMTD